MFRDRIRELRRVQAAELAPHPQNWRLHPARQQQALRGILSEIGFADALLARELPDGRLQLIDGHLRAETAPDQLVPVLVLDVTEAEAAKLLAALDPITGWAEADAAKLEELLQEFQTESPALAELLGEVAAAAGASAAAGPERPEPEIPQLWQVVVHCRDESHQRAVYERLTAEGLRCRLLVM